MRNGERTLLTMEERLGRSMRSQASSPEAAAKLVERFSKIPIHRIFFGKADVDAMYNLTGEFWEHPDVSMDSYHGFSHSFELAICQGKAGFPPASPRLPQAGGREAYQPVWGIRANNAIVLLGLMLLDHAKDQLRPKDVYYCTRMTLGQYLDALADVSFRKGGEQNQNRAEVFQSRKDMLLAHYGSSMPLEETLAKIIWRYMTAWQEFDHLDHVLRCIGGLSCYLEQEEAGRTLSQEKEESIRNFRAALCRYGSDLEGWDLVEVAKWYTDPYGYYFALAYEYPEDMPNPGSKEVAPGTLRSQIFLSERDYSPGTLRELAAKSPSTDLQELLEKYVCEERLAFAMREINTAVADLYMLWVEPYL